MLSKLQDGLVYISMGDMIETHAETDTLTVS